MLLYLLPSENALKSQKCMNIRLDDGTYMIAYEERVERGTRLPRDTFNDYQQHRRLENSTDMGSTCWCVCFCRNGIKAMESWRENPIATLSGNIEPKEVHEIDKENTIWISTITAFNGGVLHWLLLFTCVVQTCRDGFPWFYSIFLMF